MDDMPGLKRTTTFHGTAESLPHEEVMTTTLGTEKVNVIQVESNYTPEEHVSHLQKQVNDLHDETINLALRVNFLYNVLTVCVVVFAICVLGIAASHIISLF